jgi:hypothetical protein
MSDLNPGLDVRWPIGLLFTAVGALLAAYGALEGKPAGLPSSGSNLNLWWGLVMVLFGLGMIAGAWRAHQGGR